MSENRNSPEARLESAHESRSDLFAILGRFGMKTLRMKLFLLILFLSGFSLVLTCAVAYLGFYRALDASADQPRQASSVLTMILLTGIGSSLFLGIIAFIFSGHMSI